MYRDFEKKSLSTPSYAGFVGQHCSVWFQRGDNQNMGDQFREICQVCLKFVMMILPNNKNSLRPVFWASLSGSKY